MEVADHLNKKTDRESDELPATWTINVLGSKNPVLWFQCLALSQPPSEPPGLRLHMTYKTLQAETKLLAAILHVHGVKEVDMECVDFNLLWTGIHPKPLALRALTQYQRVNHFPRSYELTRKDRLSKNIEKMQHSKGGKHFDFIPQTFVMPVDHRELCSAHFRNRGPWIVKPVASSRGRGIYIVNHPDQVPLEENVVVAKYIDNPLLVDGHKCDLRLYVVVTSYDPLVVYLYEEGLVRFATVKYDTSGNHLWNPCMHLCNYSVNKYHSDYIKSDDPDAEDVGHKWTLSALLRHLRVQGSDTASLMLSIEELVVKSILASAPPIIAAVKMFVPHAQNCFELYGFDILIDSALKPWLLEVNLSPSLSCDSPLDMKIKSAMLADLLTLIGLPAVDPMVRRVVKKRPNTADFLAKLACRRVQSADSLPGSAAGKKKSSRLALSALSLTPEESRIVRSANAEFDRRGGFVRIFPSEESWQRYGAYLDPVTGMTCTQSFSSGQNCYVPNQQSHNYNLLLHQQLFPEVKSSPRHRSLQNLPRPERLHRYEQALRQGHKASIDKLSDEAESQPGADAEQVKNEISQYLEDGCRLSQYQARRLFSQYMVSVLDRVTGRSGPAMEEGHGELIIRFLQKASTNLRAPYYIKTPSSKLEGKDREAVVAKQLYDFISVYSRETEMYSEQEERHPFVPQRLFQPFVNNASEDDLEDVLSLNTRLYKCSHAYLGRCGVTGSVGVKPLKLLQTVPSLSTLRKKAVTCDCTSQPKTLPRLVKEKERRSGTSGTSSSTLPTLAFAAKTRKVSNISR